MSTKAELLEAQADSLVEEVSDSWSAHFEYINTAERILEEKGRLVVEVEMAVNKMKQFSKDFDFEMQMADTARRNAVKTQKLINSLRKKAAKERKRHG